MQLDYFESMIMLSSVGASYGAAGLAINAFGARIRQMKSAGLGVTLPQRGWTIFLYLVFCLALGSLPVFSLSDGVSWRGAGAVLIIALSGVGVVFVGARYDRSNAVGREG